MSLKDAFNSIIQLATGDFTWERPGEVTTHDIKVAPSNYSRNLAGPENTSLSGREFVIAKDEVKDLTLFPFQRGDLLISVDYGENPIDEIEPLNSTGGEVIGYRIRTA